MGSILLEKESICNLKNNSKNNSENVVIYYSNNERHVTINDSYTCKAAKIRMKQKADEIRNKIKADILVYELLPHIIWLLKYERDAITTKKQAAEIYNKINKYINKKK